MKHLITALTLTLAALPAFAASGELKAQARKIQETNQDAIVGLSIIARQEIKPEGEAASKIPADAFGGPKDQKSETNGTVVDASGLIVTSLGSISAAEMADGQEMDTRVGKVTLRVKSEIKEVKVILGDGTEVPADLVMKDADLDLAFFRVRADSPEAKGVTFKAIDLANSAVAAPLDDVVILGRMGASMGRQPMVYTGEVLGSVKKPRELLYVQTLGQGIPVFTPEGKLVGIATVRKPSKGGAANGRMEMQPAVLPAKDVLKVADQAKTAKPQAAKPEDDKGEEKK
jgi:hypothetical protein